MIAIRKCGICGGNVRKHHEAFKLNYPVLDGNGQPVEKIGKDGKVSIATYEKTMRGLGHWHCVNGCKKRQVQIQRRADSGKESEKAKTDSFPVVRDIPVETRLEKS